MNVYTERFNLIDNRLIIFKNNNETLSAGEIIKELNRMERELHNRKCDEIGDDNTIECDCGKSKPWDVASFCSNCGGVVYGVFILEGYK